MWRRTFSRFGPAAGAVGSCVAAPLLKSSAQCDSSRMGTVFPAYDAEGYTHDETAGFSMFLMERCKRVFFIRHAEGLHNVAERESKFEPKNLVLLKENSGYVYWDPRLTTRGEQQCANLKESIRGKSVWGYDMPLRLDLVVVSPTTRTLQTAMMSLGSADSPYAPPFIAHEGCRERISDCMCDGRGIASELNREFPGVDFSLITDNEDAMFEHKETEEDLQRRAQEFLQWLCGRPEVRIAVVTHSHFLKCLLRNFASEVHQDDKDYLQGDWVNAEMRSIMLCAHRKFEGPGSRPVHVRAEKSTSVMWNGAVQPPRT